MTPPASPASPDAFVDERAYEMETTVFFVFSRCGKFTETGRGLGTNRILINMSAKCVGTLARALPYKQKRKQST
jgi:hypothetical protein